MTPVHLIILLVIVLIVLGPRKLPETGAALGRAIREVRDAAEGKPDGADGRKASPSEADAPDVSGESDHGRPSE